MIPANGRWGGYFAKPTRQWFREIVAFKRLVRDNSANPKGEGRVMGGSIGQIELVDINEILKTLPPLSDVVDRPGDQHPDRLQRHRHQERHRTTNLRFSGISDRPVYPGVMMIEAMAQTAGVIGIKWVEGTQKPRAVYFLTIDKCKFRKPVMPGDTSISHAQHRKTKGHVVVPRRAPRSTASPWPRPSRCDADRLTACSRTTRCMRKYSSTT